MPNSNKTIKRMLDDFYPYAKEYLGFDKDASINFASDKDNAQNPLGKTAYYDPSNYSVTVYTDNRHPKDIMRSVSHELVHHTQNCRGDLGMSEDTGEGYAQNNEHLREMEREAYEKGNLCFRDWEDGVKANLNPTTTYEQKTRRSTISMQNFKNLTESFQAYLNEEGEYKAGDKVKDLRNDTVGTVVEPMAGGVIMELEDGTIVKTRDKFLEKVEGESVNENAPPKASDGYHIHPGRTPLKVVGGSLKGAEGKAIEITTSTKGETAIVIELTKNADKRVFGQAGDEVIVLPEDVETIGTDMADDPKMDYYNDMPSKDGEAMQEDAGDSAIAKATAIFPEAEVHEDGMGGYEIALSPESIARLESDPQLQEQLSDAFGDTWEMTEDGIAVQGAEPMNEARMSEYGKMDAEQGLPPTKIGRGNPEYMEAYNAVLVARGEEPLDVQQPDQAYLDALRSGNLEEGDGDDDIYQESETKEEYNGHLWEDIEKIVNKTLEEYGDHETQAQGGMVSSTYSSDPEMDQVADIAATVVEQGGFLMQIATALKDQGFSASLRSGVLMIDDKYFMGKPAKFDIGPDEPVQEVGPYVVGMMDNQMKEGESRHNTPDFFDSDEEKEMMKKMSNKEFYDYVTRDRHTVPNLKGDMGPMDGLEGPFQFKSGAVLYYDPKAGKYYDRGKDMYLDNEEASKLTMENDTMESDNNNSLREKVKTAVMSKLSEMFDDDDMYGDEDPYMAGLEAEFPWLKDKKPKRVSKGDDAAMAAAARDAAAAGEFQPDEEEEVEEPTVMNETYDDAVYEMADKVIDALGHEETLMNVYKAMSSQDMMENLEYIARMHDIDLPEGERWDAYEAVEQAMGAEQMLQGTLQAMSTEEATETLDFIMRNYGIGEGDEDMYETTLRDRVMARVEEMINQKTVEEEQKSTEKHDDDPALKGDQDELPDELQAAIIDKADDKSDKPDDEKNEGKMKYSREEEKEEVEEAKHEEEKEEVEEAIAANPEDFYRQLRNESRVVNRPEWNEGARNKRTSVLNERLMKVWFDK